jgi:hypothetical protein
MAVSDPRPRRRIVVTVCPREAGVVALAVRRGEPAELLDAPAIAQWLRHLVAERKLEGSVGVHEACAGGCGRAGPNIGVSVYAVPPPGRKPDNVAIRWKTYVYSLASLDCLAAIIDENLPPPE